MITGCKKKGTANALWTAHSKGHVNRALFFFFFLNHVYTGVIFSWTFETGGANTLLNFIYLGFALQIRLLFSQGCMYYSCEFKLCLKQMCFRFVL